MPIQQMFFARPSVAEYTAQGVTFDGSNDYIRRGGDLTGSADSKLWTGSFWIRLNNLGIGQTIGTNVVFSWEITFKAPGDNLQLLLQNASSSNILIMKTSALNINWHHILFSVDMANVAKRHLFVDDVSDLAVSLYVNNTIDFTDTNHSIGARTTGTTKLNGDLADFWMDFGRYVDFSIESNRRKFITAGGCPEPLGDNGELPFSAAPIMFFSGDTDDWHTNKGTGGGFTETGALTDAATNPC